jgi:hypothetical protein
MNQETAEVFNRFLQVLFNGNAAIDNICYNLKYKGYARIEAAIHGPMAHEMGAWADEVSDLMDELGGRPVRYALPDNVKEADAGECLDDLVSYFEELKAVTIKAIEAFDEYGEVAAKVFFEDFLRSKVAVYLRQAIEWRDAFKAMGADSLNVHIAAYTSYLKK